MKKTILLLTGLVFLTFKNQAQIVTDIDGNVYNTVTIGTQVWMKENLKVTHYRNGNVIPNITNDSIWRNLITGARCYNHNDSAINAPVYGGLYNWYAIEDSRKLCPIGWHVPSDGDWNILEKYLDNTTDTTAIIQGDIGYADIGTDLGGKLKEAGTVHWFSPNTGATNSSGFSALPGGHNGGYGYNSPGGEGVWWASTMHDAISAMSRSLDNDRSTGRKSFDILYAGFSIRCLCDSFANQINENSIENNILIYPNPAKYRLTIESIQKLTLEILNIQGQVILKKQLQQGKTDIDISGLAKGLYILRINNNNMSEVTRFVKE